MDTNLLSEKLMAFGLTRQEAVIYLELVQTTAATGYEIAKQTGISRSNVYNALAGLVDKGAAYVLDGPVTRYQAAEVSEFCHNKLKALQEAAQYLKAHVPKGRTDTEGYLTISGDDKIRDKAQYLLKTVKERAYVSMSMEHIRLFLPELSELLAEGKKLVLLTNGTPDLPGAIFYPTEDKGDQIGIITDSAYVLSGELGKGAHSSCLYTGQPNFVQVFKDSMRNEIKLIELTKGEK